METTGPQTRYKCLLFTYITCTTFFTLTLFLSSFFPLPHHSNSTSTPSDIPTTINGIDLSPTTLYKPSAQKLVFMVVDALRWDFVTSATKTDWMPSTTASLSNNSACLIQARATTPTVTMPRIKSMMTGGVSGFLDIVLNIGETSSTGDSVLNQAKNHNHRIIFYGDDTWLRLFPKTFHRSEGTDSFFVSDFYQVDHNVTRNVDQELNNDDWSVMILHYLGLDHIGHVLGPQSPLISSKLREMDGVISKILAKIEVWNSNGTPSLLVVTGDHGMKNSGGHGGATPEETLVPFIVFGRTCSSGFKQMEQVDIAATLSMILGIPLPQSNLGSVSLDLIKDLPNRTKLFLLHYNVKHLFKHFRKLSEFESSEIYDNYYRVIKLHTEWLIGKTKSSNHEQAIHIINLYDKVLKGMKEILIKSAVKYDRTIMTIAIVMSLQILGIILNKYRSFSVKRFCYWWTSSAVLWLTLNHCFYSESNEEYFELRDVYTMLIVFVFFTLNCSLCPPLSASIPSTLNFELSKVVFPAFMVLQVMSLTSSSFVEEEHQTWYFYWITFASYLLWEELSRIYNAYRKNISYNVSRLLKITFLLIQHRVLRKLNSTGDKYAHLPDIGGWLKGQESHAAMTVAVIMSLALLILIGFVWEDWRERRVTLGFHVALSVFVYSRHASEKSVINFMTIYADSKGVREAQTFLLILAVFIAYSIRRWVLTLKNERAHFQKVVVATVIRIWVMMTVFLHRPHNLILVSMELMTILVVYDLMKHKDCGKMIYLSYWVGNVFYFYQGNSNSVATIDVAAGYVGLTSYWPTLATIYVSVNTYSAPVLAYLMLVYKSLGDYREKGYRLDVFSINRGYACIRIFTVVVYNIIVTSQRYHLFIWTVFSPKLLYEAMYTAVLFVVMFVMQGAIFMSNK